MKEINLEPCECPYCGSFKVVKCGETTHPQAFYIECKKCGARGPKSPTLPGAIQGME